MSPWQQARTSTGAQVGDEALERQRKPPFRDVVFCKTQRKAEEVRHGPEQCWDEACAVGGSAHGEPELSYCPEANRSPRLAIAISVLHPAVSFNGQLVIGVGIPRVYALIPIPVPADTHTHHHGYGSTPYPTGCSISVGWMGT